MPQESRVSSLSPIVDLDRLRDAIRHGTGKGVRVAVIDSGVDGDHPAFAGKLISATPETKPKTLVLAIADKDSPTPTADVTINLDSPLPGKAEGDTIITFQGIPDSYTATPFMVTFTAAKADIKGWTGKAEPVRRPVRRRPAATE